MGNLLLGLYSIFKSGNFIVCQKTFAALARLRPRSEVGKMKGYFQPRLQA